MINPRTLEVGYKKDRANPYAMKAYRAVVGRPLRKKYRTATEAHAQAARVFVRWCRLYDAAIVAMANPSPVQEGESHAS